MRNATTYIYGKESGHIYWSGYDPLHSVYRYALGVEDYKPYGKGELGWIEILDEDICSATTRFGLLGVAVNRCRRRIREFLGSKSYIRTNKKTGKKHRVSAYDWVCFICSWILVLSGIAAFIAAFTVLTFPFNIMAGAYGAGVAAFVAHEI